MDAQICYAPCPRLPLRIHRYRAHFLPEPRSEGAWVEANGISDFVTGDAAVGRKLVDLALTDVQQRGYIGHGKGCRSLCERVRDPYEPPERVAVMTLPDDLVEIGEAAGLCSRIFRFNRKWRRVQRQEVLPGGDVVRPVR